MRADAWTFIKLKNSRTLLMRYRRQMDQPELDTPIERLANLLERAGRVHTVNSLLGVEGMGAAVYFEALPRLFKRDGWQFDKRSRRPPADPPSGPRSMM